MKDALKALAELSKSCTVTITTRQGRFQPADDFVVGLSDGWVEFRSQNFLSCDLSEAIFEALKCKRDHDVQKAETSS